MVPLSLITARARTKFEQQSATRWPDAAFHKAINEGLDELSEATHFYERVVSIPVVPDRIYYDLRGYIPDDFISVRAVWSVTLDDWLDPTTPEKLHQRWEETVGDPYAYFTRGWNWLGVYPHPENSSTSVLRVYFSSLAPHFLHPQAVLSDLTDDFTRALEDYAVYDLQCQDGETDKALVNWAAFSTRQQRLAGFVNQRARSAGNIGGRR